MDMFRCRIRKENGTGHLTFFHPVRLTSEREHIFLCYMIPGWGTKSHYSSRIYNLQESAFLLSPLVLIVSNIVSGSHLKIKNEKQASREPSIECSSTKTNLVTDDRKNDRFQKEPSDNCFECMAIKVQEMVYAALYWVPCLLDSTMGTQWSVQLSEEKLLFEFNDTLKWNKNLKLSPMMLVWYQTV